jgi:hypothetical protein
MRVARDEQPMSGRRGVWALLESPLVYEAFRRLIGARGWLQRLANDVILARGGDRVLDIDRMWTRRAVAVSTIHNCLRRLRPQPGLHRAGQANLRQPRNLDDERASSLLCAIGSALKSGGQVLAVDPCFHPWQSAIQRLVVKSDRGMHVRPFELFGGVFSAPRAMFQQGTFPFPHSICIVQATRALA